ncbi:MAG: sigma-54 interaction domain-containing protein [Gammaproteobacteria bacterium]
MVWLSSSENPRETCHVGVIGRSLVMQRVQERVERLARSDVTTLVCGETGTGKEIIAQALHQSSARSSGPWICVNCAGIPDGLVESELFGHMKGAFTGAIQDRLGRFEAAHRGTLFLDEIGDISPAVQVRLLRAVETKHIERVGSHRTREVDVRIIAATNKSLEEEVRSRRFRADLYYRLNIASIELPPLRSRREDIPLLVQHFIEQAKPLHHHPITDIEEDAMERLTRYPWPGNVRELRNAIECACVNARDEHIRLSDLPPHLHASPSTAMLGSSGPAKCPPPFAFDAPSLRDVLADNRWHITHTAASLGIHRTTLWRLMQRLGIPSARSEG